MPTVEIFVRRLPLAAELTPMISSGGPQATVAFAIGLGVIVIALVIGGLSSRNKTRGRASSSPSSSRKVSIKHQGEALGLSKVHINTIETILERHPTINRSQVFSNSAVLDRVLQEGMDEIESQVSSDQIKEREKLTLFQIKQIVERNSKKTAAIKGTRNFSPGLKFVISSETGARLSTEVLTILKDGIGLSLPRDPKTDTPIKLNKGMGISIFYWKANGQGFSFPSKVLGYIKIRGRDSLLIKHSAVIKEATQRRFRRKTLQRPCYFYPVRVVTLGVGKAQEKKAMVESKRGNLGTVLEVSSGGCSIKTTFPLPRGDLVKVEFETEKKSNVSAYGKVVNYTPEQPLGGIMHVQFTRVSQKFINRINSYIYGI